MAMTLIPALRDNTMHGWIYGYGSILSTHNGGLTWVYETPNSLILGVAGTSATEILVRFRLSHFSLCILAGLLLHILNRNCANRLLFACRQWQMFRATIRTEFGAEQKRSSAF